MEHAAIPVGAVSSRVPSAALQGGSYGRTIRPRPLAPLTALSLTGRHWSSGSEPPRSPRPRHIHPFL